MLYELESISYRYLGRFPALNGIDLKIGQGESIALLGANGSGKSTLLMVLAGLIFPESGRVRFNGEEMNEEALSADSFGRNFRKRVGIVFQNSDIQLFNSTVRDELLFGLIQLDIPEGSRRDRLSRYAEIMGISGLLDRHPQNLSIGEKKRAAIASVLVMEPEVLLLDEPTAGLDPRTTRHLVETMSDFAERGRTIISSTQDMHLVSEISERVIVLGEDRQKAKDASSEEVLADIAFLEAHNLIHVHAHRHKNLMHVHPHEHPSHGHPHSQG